MKLIKEVFYAGNTTPEGQSYATRKSEYVNAKFYNRELNILDLDFNKGLQLLIEKSGKYGDIWVSILSTDYNFHKILSKLFS